MTAKHTTLGVVILLTLGIFAAGCDVGVLPLLFDGSPVAATYTVDSPGSSYSGTESINLEGVLSGIDKDIDSIKVFNISLMIDSIKAPTTAGTTISGSATINGTDLLTLTNAPLSAFAVERSIFDTTLASSGVTPSAAGVSVLQGLLAQKPRPTVTVAYNAHTSSGELHFTAHFKLYTQLYGAGK